MRSCEYQKTFKVDIEEAYQFFKSETVDVYVEVSLVDDSLEIERVEAIIDDKSWTVEELKNQNKHAHFWLCEKARSFLNELADKAFNDMSNLYKGQDGMTAAKAFDENQD